MNFISEHAGMIGLLFFVGFFVGMLLWIFRPGSKERYEHDKNIPLEDDK